MSTLSTLIKSIIDRQIDPAAGAWLSERAVLVRQEAGMKELALSFTALPRKTGKKELILRDEDRKELSRLRPGLDLQGWTLDRLARVWLLMQLDPADKDGYIKKIETLFGAAEMNELVALYSALPVLEYPEAWKARCAEGIRSNIGIVLEAIMLRNPYPAEWLEEGAWNQLVMKAFFTDKDIPQITGLQKRANKDLAGILSDYAKERLAAGRAVNPHLWELAGIQPLPSN